jgi:hypothetical protein
MAKVAVRTAAQAQALENGAREYLGEGHPIHLRSETLSLGERRNYEATEVDRLVYVRDGEVKVERAVCRPDRLSSSPKSPVRPGRTRLIHSADGRTADEIAVWRRTDGPPEYIEALAGQKRSAAPALGTAPRSLTLDFSRGSR